MHLLKYLYLALGAALFVALLAAFDTESALALVWDVGLIGLLGIGLAFALAFLLDVGVWLMCLSTLRPSAAWFLRLARVRIAGESFNLIMPAGGFGGEPLKVVLLKVHHGLGYKETTAAIALARLIGLLAQWAFVAAALVAMTMASRLSASMQAAAWVAFLVLTAMAASFALLPKLRLSSRLSRSAVRRRWGNRLAHALTHIEDVEARVDGFSAAHRWRFIGALLLSFIRWTAGALETWLALYLLGFPLSLLEIIVIEAILQMSRSISFFIPANLGAQDGALALVAAALTGSPAAGLGVALLRRVRELLYIALGMAVGAWFTLRASRSARRARSMATPQG